METQYSVVWCASYCIILSWRWIEPNEKEYNRWNGMYRNATSIFCPILLYSIVFCVVAKCYAHGQAMLLHYYSTTKCLPGRSEKPR